MSDIYLRELERIDLPSINRWRNNEDLVANLVAPFRYISSSVDSAWLDSYLSSRSNSVRLAICDGSTHAIIGAVYLLSIDWVARSSEFGIWIGEEGYRGRGVGGAATRKALWHAFNDLNLNRVTLTVLESNAAAISLYKKVGFTVEGKLRQAAYKRGKYQDMIQMAILADEFASAAPV